MSQEERALAFGALHRKGDPVVLYNIWDAGSARCVAEAGAKALATGSWSVAAAHGYGDGQKLPLPLLLETVREIVAATDLPLSVDFEGAYSEDPAQAAANVAQVIDAADRHQFRGTRWLAGAASIRSTSRRLASGDPARWRTRQGIALFVNAARPLPAGSDARATAADGGRDRPRRGLCGWGASGFFRTGPAIGTSSPGSVRHHLCGQCDDEAGAPDIATLAARRRRAGELWAFHTGDDRPAARRGGECLRRGKRLVPHPRCPTLSVMTRQDGEKVRVRAANKARLTHDQRACAVLGEDSEQHRMCRFAVRIDNLWTPALIASHAGLHLRDHAARDVPSAISARPRRRELLDEFALLVENAGTSVRREGASH